VIVGAGPAGLFLAHLLHRAGIDSIVLEQRSSEYVAGRVRAGVLEQMTVDLMERLGLGERMRREGLVHGGTNIAWDDQTFRLDLEGLTGGSTVMVYGQSEVVADLNKAAEIRGVRIVYEAEGVALHDLDGDRPSVTYRKDGLEHRIACDFVAGCDGFHGISRTSIPASVLRTFEKAYPFGWLGILAEVPPANHELIYCNHERGFALASMRSPTRSRYYIQCALDDPLEAWPDDRFWDEICLRLGPEAAAGVVRGPSFEKSIAPLRSFVAEPMRHGRRRRAHRAAHRRQGTEPGGGRRRSAVGRPDRVLHPQLVRRHRQLFRPGAFAGLEGGAILLVVHQPDASVSGGRGDDAPTAGGRAGLYPPVARRADEPCRELCRAPARMDRRRNANRGTAMTGQQQVKGRE
jgi:p-hydroxybenzoate 3-monooxygenase